jgi:lipoprotein-anchoring transpeptidase ErfK/SrfK
VGAPTRWLLSAAAGLSLALGIGAGNVAAFGARASGLEGRWSAIEQSGVSEAALAPLRSRLAAAEARRLGPIPYTALSDGLFGDPLGGMEQQTQALWDQQLAASRQDAQAALGRLQLNQDGAGAVYTLERSTALDRAQTPSDYRRLAVAFDRESGLAGRQALDDLAALSGGLVDGRPADIVAAIASLTGQVDRLRSAGLPTDPGPLALDEAARYLLLSPGLEAAEHDAVAADLQAAAAQLGSRISARDRASTLLAQARELLAQYSDLNGSAGAFPNRYAQARAALDSARDEAAVTVASGLAESLVADLSAEIARFNLAPGLTAGAACISPAPPKLIVVHLSTQSLIAYENGCPFVQTLVTTGRPALRTDRGDFHVFARSSPYKFVSPWPLGSPFWYHSAWVNWAVEIVGDGTYLHDAPWQPDGTYGPGSENGPYSSHGCIHVPTSVMRLLWAWTPIGTEVIVGA